MAKTSTGDLIITATFNLDIDELFDYRYHIDGTARKVYATDLMYICSGSDPNKDEALREFSEWKQYDGDQFWIEKYKTKVWVSVEEFIHPDDVNN